MNEEKGIDPLQLLKIISGDYDTDLKDMLEFYFQIASCYMRINFRNGCYGVIHDAQKVLILFQKDKIVKDIFDDFNLDLSHMLGMTKTEMQMLILPFEDRDDADFFAYMMREIRPVYIFQDGVEIK